MINEQRDELEREFNTLVDTGFRHDAWTAYESRLREFRELLLRHHVALERALSSLGEQDMAPFADIYVLFAPPDETRHDLTTGG